MAIGQTPFSTFGNVFSKATTAALGGIKSLQALDRFSNKMGGTISDTATNAISSSTMMSGALNKEFGQDISAQLITSLQQQDFITGQEINYQNCNAIDSLSLNGYNKAAHSICDQIAVALANDYQAKKDSFAQYLVSLLTGHMVAINKNDLIKPLAHEFSGDIIEQAVKELKKAQAEAETEAKADKKKEKPKPKRKASDGEAIKEDLKAEAEAKEKAKQKAKEGRKNKQTANCPGDGPGVCNIPRAEPKTCSVDGSCGTNKEPYGPPVPRELLIESDKKILDTYEAKQEAIKREAMAASETNIKKAAQIAGKLKDEYEAFSAKHPLLAEYGLSALNIAIQTLMAGPAGTLNAARVEVTGYAIGKLAGEELAQATSFAIETAAEKLRNSNPELSYEESVDLSSVSIFAAFSVAEGTGVAKVILKESGTLKKVHLETVNKVGPNYPRNAEYAGKTYHMKDAPDSIKKDYPDLEQKYPQGVEFNEKGFPIFEPYATHKVEIQLTGDYKKDFKAADQKAGFIKRPDGYTWHHHEDGKTMLLIPNDLHKAVGHTGGFSVNKHKTSGR